MTKYFERNLAKMREAIADPYAPKTQGWLTNPQVSSLDNVFLQDRKDVGHIVLQNSTPGAQASIAQHLVEVTEVLANTNIRDKRYIATSFHLGNHFVSAVIDTNPANRTITITNSMGGYDAEIRQIEAGLLRNFPGSNVKKINPNNAPDQVLSQADGSTCGFWAPFNNLLAVTDFQNPEHKERISQLINLFFNATINAGDFNNRNGLIQRLGPIYTQFQRGNRGPGYASYTNELLSKAVTATKASLRPGYRAKYGYENHQEIAPAFHFIDDVIHNLSDYQVQAYTIDNSHEGDPEYILRQKCLADLNEICNDTLFRERFRSDIVKKQITDSDSLELSNFPVTNHRFPPATLSEDRKKLFTIVQNFIAQKLGNVSAADVEGFIEYYKQNRNLQPQQPPRPAVPAPAAPAPQRAAVNRNYQYYDQDIATLLRGDVFNRGLRFLKIGQHETRILVKTGSPGNELGAEITLDEANPLQPQNFSGGDGFGAVIMAQPLEIQGQAARNFANNGVMQNIRQDLQIIQHLAPTKFPVKIIIPINSGGFHWQACEVVVNPDLTVARSGQYNPGGGVMNVSGEVRNLFDSIGVRGFGAPYSAGVNIYNDGVYCGGMARRIASGLITQNFPALAATLPQAQNIDAARQQDIDLVHNLRGQRDVFKDQNTIDIFARRDDRRLDVRQVRSGKVKSVADQFVSDLKAIQEETERRDTIPDVLIESINSRLLHNNLTQQEIFNIFWLDQSNNDENLVQASINNIVNHFISKAKDPAYATQYALFIIDIAKAYLSNEQVIKLFENIDTSGITDAGIKASIDEQVSGYLNDLRNTFKQNYKLKVQAGITADGQEIEQFGVADEARWDPAILNVQKHSFAQSLLTTFFETLNEHEVANPAAPEIPRLLVHIKNQIEAYNTFITPSDYSLIPVRHRNAILTDAINSEIRKIGTVAEEDKETAAIRLQEYREYSGVNKNDVNLRIRTAIAASQDSTSEESLSVWLKYFDAEVKIWYDSLSQPNRNDFKQKLVNKGWHNSKLRFDDLDLTRGLDLGRIPPAPAPAAPPPVGNNPDAALPAGGQPPARPAPAKRVEPKVEASATATFKLVLTTEGSKRETLVFESKSKKPPIITPANLTFETQANGKAKIAGDNKIAEEITPNYVSFKGLTFKEEPAGPKIFGAANLFMANFQNCKFVGVDFSGIKDDIIRSMKFTDCVFERCTGIDITPNQDRNVKQEAAEKMRANEKMQSKGKYNPTQFEKMSPADIKKMMKDADVKEIKKDSVDYSKDRIEKRPGTSPRAPKMVRVTEGRVI